MTPLTTTDLDMEKFHREAVRNQVIFLVVVVAWFGFVVGASWVIAKARHPGFWLARATGGR